jgi:hypothetical protein
MPFGRKNYVAFSYYMYNNKITQVYLGVSEMKDKHEVFKQNLITVENHPSRMPEIYGLALLLGLLAVLAIPVIGALIGPGPHGGFLGSAWKTAWLYGIMAVYTVIFWWE